MKEANEEIKRIFFVILFIAMGLILNPRFYVPEFFKYLTEVSKGKGG